MNVRSVSLVAALLFLVAFGACSDDDNPVDGGTTDTTPPGVTSVVPVDAFHVDVIFTEEVTKASAEDGANYLILEAGAPSSSALRASATPGDTVRVAAAIRKPDKKSVTITTFDTMAGLIVSLAVHGVADTHGNDITTPVQKLFTGSNDPDTTPPSIASRVPAAGATGVAVSTVIVIQFSEPLSIHSVALSVAPGIPVAVNEDQFDMTTWKLNPVSPLQHNTVYTVTATASDPSNNAMPEAQWSFTTAASTDNTPPTLVSTSPANLATGVDVDANLSITFSEAIDQDNNDIAIFPDAGDGVATWSNGGKTVTFDPDYSLLADQQYVVTIFPEGVFDLAGNGIRGVQTVVFTTASSLEPGAIAGTLTGDPGTAAADPTGAHIVATNTPHLDSDLDILGSAVAAGNNTYSIAHLADGAYWLLSVLDTNGDHLLNLELGDALGAYGMDLATSDFDPDSVMIAGGNHATGINFPLYDSSAIVGAITYDGAYQSETYPVYIGLYDNPSFAGDGVAGALLDWPNDTSWVLNTLDQGFPDGTYYVAAYMDVNYNYTYDPATDPAGAYGGTSTPTALNVSNGNDQTGIVISLMDPSAGMSMTRATWPATSHNPAFQRWCKVVSQVRLPASK